MGGGRVSSKCVGAVFDRYPGGGGEMLLALALADNAHEDGSHIFPSVDTMAKKSRQSVRAVQMHLRTMVDSGWLQVVKNAQGGRGRLVEYRINPAWLKGADIAPFIASGQPVDNSLKGAVCDQKRVQNDALKGAKLDTKGCNLRHPYITSITPIEPNTPLTPQGGQVVGVDIDAGSGSDSGPVDQTDPAEGFAAFWAAWPVHANKQGEVLCLQRWKRKRLHRFAVEIVADVVARRASPKWVKGFIEAPTKYLKESRWLDAQPGMPTSAQSWDHSREGIEAMGVSLGLGRWDEAEHRRTNTQATMYHVYVAKVRAAVERLGNGAD